MALNATTLAAAIKTPTKAAYIACGAADNAALETFVTALSAAIASSVISHFQTNGVITVSLTTGSGTIA